MDRNNVLNFTRLGVGPDFRGAMREQDRSEVGIDIFRNNGIGLIAGLLVSLGLWGAIGVAVASLVSRVAG
jgi:hypothetical protein